MKIVANGFQYSCDSPTFTTYHLLNILVWSQTICLIWNQSAKLVQVNVFSTDSSTYHFKGPKNMFLNIYIFGLRTHIGS